MHRLLLLLLLLPACEGLPDAPGDYVRLCPTVTGYARPPGGGACQEFGVACDIPADYVTCCGPETPDLVGCSSPERCVDDPLDSCTPDAGTGPCQRICT